MNGQLRPRISYLSWSRKAQATRVWVLLSKSCSAQAALKRKVRDCGDILGLLIKRNGLWYLDTNKFQIWNTYNLPAQTDKANEAAQKSRTASVLA